MKKLWKWNKKHCGGASEGKNDEEGAPPHHGPFGGRHRWGGRGGRHRHHPFAGPPPSWENHCGTFAMAQDQDQGPGPMQLATRQATRSVVNSEFTTPGFDSDSSSTSSSSSESDMEMETRGKKGSHTKHSRKKSKKKQKRLSKRQKKIRKRIQKLSY